MPEEGGQFFNFFFNYIKFFLPTIFFHDENFYWITQVSFYKLYSDTNVVNIAQVVYFKVIFTPDFSNESCFAKMNL